MPSRYKKADEEIWTPCSPLCLHFSKFVSKILLSRQWVISLTSAAIFWLVSELNYKLSFIKMTLWRLVRFFLAARRFLGMQNFCIKNSEASVQNMYNVLYFCNVVELNGMALHEFAILTLKFANWYYLIRETGTNKYFIGWDQLVYAYVLITFVLLILLNWNCQIWRIWNCILHIWSKYSVITLDNVRNWK